DIANAIVSPIANPIYNGSQQIPPLTIAFEGTALVKDTDYIISITSMDGIDTSAGTKAGKVTITITGKGNFHGEKTNLTYTIQPKALINDMLTVTGGTFIYSGIPITPDVTVTDGTTLISGTDYDITYSNNTNAGVANITVIGNGNYTGTASKSFIIQKAPAPTIIWPTSANIVYGSLLSDSALVGGSTGYGDFIWKTPKAIPTVTNSGYEVIFTPSATTVNNYELISQTTKIVQIVVTAKSISGFTVDSIDSPIYNGATQTPFVVVKDSVTTLTSGTDYDVSYSDNIGAGTATVAIKGKGNYTSTMSKNFTIKKRPVTVKANDKIMTRGGSLPALTYTVDGQLSGETALAGVPSLSCVADGETVGSYPITIDLVGVSYTENYEAANPVLVNGTLTVNDLPSSGSDSDSSFGNHTTTTSPEKRPNQPVSAETSLIALAGQNGRASANLSDITIFGAIVKAQAKARAQGKIPNGIGIALNVNLPQDASSLSLSLSQNALQNLVSTGVTRFTINGAIASLSLDLEALKEIQKQGAERITITIKPVHNISSGARAIIGTRPVYDVTVSYSKDSKTVNITSLGKGSATLSIPYVPGKNETVGYLFGVYVDGKGNIIRIPGSCYDANSNSLLISTDHFSVYGVGYTTPNANFTDIGNHWGKESIDYVFGRSLLFGTSETTFAPNSAMTRGMLVTALGRLAGVDEKAYTTNNFTDVKADSTFRPYIEWAYKKGVLQGIGNQQFAPNRAITREEISVIFANYAKATGHKLPVTREAAAYADATSIRSVYKTAVTAMQQAGIMMGGMGNRFNPKSNATRAEVSSMLYRYIKLTIDSATAQGWALNDAGQYFYYIDGKPLIGMQTIEGAKYFFNTDGTLKTGWVEDGGNWHFCDGNKLRTGWLDVGRDSSKRTYYFDTYGNMISGKWLEIDDKWYYFYADGSLAKNAKVDGYEVDVNGVRKRK
ncbi:MAG: S-layer homology domain-containing protein, partial [Oscillospiraceae bacterium]|nr:S-layer homology domain-containing protein [Oscillospiraceae bacterium]